MLPRRRQCIEQRTKSPTAHHTKAQNWMAMKSRLSMMEWNTMADTSVSTSCRHARSSGSGSGGVGTRRGAVQQQAAEGGGAAQGQDRAARRRGQEGRRTAVM